MQTRGFGLATRGLPSEIELDAAAGIGCDRVEIGLRWDQRRALDVCARRCAQARERGLEPTVVLDVGGDDRWVGLAAPAAFARWTDEALTVVSECSRWNPVAPPNVHARRRHLDGRHRSTGHFLRALDHQLAAHVLAAASIARAVPGATFTFDVGSERLYEMDGLLLDILVAPAAGIDRSDIGNFLRARRTEWYRAADAHRAVVPPRERLRRWISLSVIPLEQALPRAIAAVFDTSGPVVHRVRRDRPAIDGPAVPLDLELVGDANGERPVEAVAIWRSSTDAAFAEEIRSLRAVG